MADQDDDDVRRKVVGALVKKLLAADLAPIDDLEEAAEHPPAPAVRTPSPQSAQDGLEGSDPVSSDLSG
jgi:hypothetical protein